MIEFHVIIENDDILIWKHIHKIIFSVHSLNSLENSVINQSSIGLSSGYGPFPIYFLFFFINEYWQR